ncbi:hypothetical protein [Pontibacter mangrovi]|uniref:hypothetical protein n=1 Tax=Pontibacter mangrovi TaxID=2589816 RepID=UPI001126594E|nr:hypothetical protein [Pontibacter mangrovi]
MGCTEKEQAAPLQAIASTSAPEYRLVAPDITEASGIADSKANPGHLWVQEDSGNPTQLYLLSHSGDRAKAVFLKGAANRDWEDIALSGNDLYLADIGDNTKAHELNTIYKFAEPDATTDTVQVQAVLRFRYPDGAHDAEAFLVDRSSGHLLLITKGDRPSRMYRVAPAFGQKPVTAEFLGELPYNGVVSAAQSEDGKSLVLKTYTHLYFYRRGADETIAEVLQQKALELPYVVEPQGEAVCFTNSGNGYFTLSEKSFAEEVLLHFYKLQAD